MFIRSLVLTLALFSTAMAADPPPQFVPEVVPKGFNKRQALVLNPEKDKMSVLTSEGSLSPLGRYLLAMATDPRNVEAHFHFLFSSDSGNWKVVHAPLYTGTVAGNEGHRFPRLLAPFAQLIGSGSSAPAQWKTGLMDEAWVSAVERMFREMLNADGLLARDRNEATMALTFHLLRTGFGTMKLHPERIYTLPNAQALVRTLLTKPYIIHAQDEWLPATETYLAECTKANNSAKYADDATLIKNGTVFFSGGLFIGWKASRPSLHATWDGLTTINTLFSYYPEPDPTKPNSIFYLWNQQPRDVRAGSLGVIRDLSRKLWLDFLEKKGPSYCHIVDGKATLGDGKPTDLDKPGEVPQLFDHAGYSKAEYNIWAASCWEEMFGNPKRNTNNGAQALLAIANGRVLRELKTPTGEQKTPGAPGTGVDEKDAE